MYKTYLLGILIFFISIYVGCNPGAGLPSNEPLDIDFNKPNKPNNPSVPDYEEKEHIITTNLVGNPLSEVRVRGYIVPEDKLSLFVTLIRMDTEVKGLNQSKGLTMSQYQRITGYFSSLFTPQYNLNYLASVGVDDYISGSDIIFDFNTYSLTINGVLQSFENSESITSLFLTRDKTWALADAERYFYNSSYIPDIDVQYYILWILESKTYSVGQDKMYIRLLSQDASDTPLYTITH
ncbi:hypothetical protein PVA45_02805 [Entomospira entomophila]|uniref:Uncharacterized protein n=1 Tax=Entomospira entomophila TaxID=2719988 RepID=A0A968GDJ2_9SPIO|nr:hypothetical protein [Entomospira entomophilus]NIZ40444.1 hypothetical protein [Entomospira entomophilus]WDI36002.1 hypothetical protein PVA45_02805 [Entomospira entomophilus]